MEKNVQNKKDVRAGLRKAIFPIALIAAIAMFFAAFFQVIGTTNTDTISSGEVILAEVYEYNWTKGMLDAARYIAIIAFFVAIIAACLMIAYAIISFVKLNKANLKQEIILGVLNSIASVLILVFAIICLTRVFKVEEWSYITETRTILEEEYKFIYPAIFNVTIEKGYDIYNQWYQNLAFMGVIFVSVFYISVYAEIIASTRLAKQDINKKALRVFAVYAFSLAIWMIPLVGFTMSGFKKPGEDAEMQTRVNFTGASMMIKFVLASVCAASITLLGIIPFAIFGKQDWKKYTIMFAITGGIALIMMAAAAGMAKMTINIDDPKEIKWTSESATICALALISWIAALVGGSLAYAKTNKFLAPKAPKAAKAA